MSEPAFIPFCFCNVIRRYPLGLFDFLNYHLRYPVAIVNDLFISRKIHEDHFYFAPIIRIDCSGCVKTGNTLFDGESASRPYLGFITFRQFNKNSC